MTRVTYPSLLFDPTRLQKRPENVLSNTLHALFWVGLAAASWYYGNIWKVLTTDPRLNLLAFRLCLLSFATVVVIFAYLTVYHGFIRGATESYFDLAPRLVSIVTVAFLSMLVLFTVAAWPVWGGLSIPIMFVNMMAFFMHPALIPDCLFARRNRKDH